MVNKQTQVTLLVKPKTAREAILPFFNYKKYGDSYPGCWKELRIPRDFFWKRRFRFASDLSYFNTPRGSYRSGIWWRWQWCRGCPSMTQAASSNAACYAVLCCIIFLPLLLCNFVIGQLAGHLLTVNNNFFCFYQRLSKLFQRRHYYTPGCWVTEIQHAYASLKLLYLSRTCTIPTTSITVAPARDCLVWWTAVPASIRSRMDNAGFSSNERTSHAQSLTQYTIVHGPPTTHKYNTQ